MAISVDGSIWNETFNVITLASVFSGRETSGMCSANGGSRTHRKKAGMCVWQPARVWLLAYVDVWVIMHLCAHLFIYPFHVQIINKQNHLPAEELPFLLTLINMQSVFYLLSVRVCVCDWSRTVNVLFMWHVNACPYIEAQIPNLTSFALYLQPL